MLDVKGLECQVGDSRITRPVALSDLDVGFRA